MEWDWITSGRPRPRPCPSRCRSRSRSFFSFLTETSSLGLGSGEVAGHPCPSPPSWQWGFHLRACFAHRDPTVQVPASKTASAPQGNAYEATYSSLIFLLIMLGVKVFCKREQRDKSLHERR